MSDAYNFIFSDDPRTGTLTASQLQARRQIAVALATRNRPYPKTIGEGLTAFGEGLGEGMYNRNLDRAEAVQRRIDAEAMRGPTGAVRPAPGGASMEGDPNAAVADATESKQPLTPTQASQQPQMPIEEWLQRVARNESGSRKDAYTLVGERSRRGDYPYGKYQVMGENVPAWTQAYLGKKMTPEEFLANPDAQEQVARARGGEYLTKYGPEGAAAAWFAGEKGMNDPNRKDTLGTHVAEYRRRFNIPLVSRDQVVASAARAPAAAQIDPENAAPVQVASLGGGMPTLDTAPDITRDDVAQSLVAQQGVVPPRQAPGPPPVQVAQAPQQQLPIGPQPAQATPYAGAQGVEPAPASAPGIRPVPQVPNYPAIGPEPTRTSVVPPQVAAEMQHWDRVKGNPNVSAEVHAYAKDKFDKLQSQMNDEYTKQWTHWRTETDKRVQHEVERPGKQIQLETGTLAAEKARQEIEKNKSEEALRKQYGNLPQAEVIKRVAESKDTADKSVTAFNAIRTARSALDAGAITGFGANQRLDWAKLNQLMGLGDRGSEIANTEVFRSSMAPAVASMLKATVGTTQISNTDRDFAEKAAGGQITLDAASIKRLLDVSHRLSLETMGKHQTTMDAIYRDNPQAQALFGVDPPAPQHHIERLIQNKDNPEYIKDFDAKYYRGAAQRIINRGY